MFTWLVTLLGAPGFEPHGSCFLWTKSLLWLYVLSDSVITISYYSIPIALIYFVSKRQDLAFNWIFIMFGIFIMGCGTTHLVGILTIWNPVYWLDGIVKALTAGVSIVTAILLWPLIPKALALPSPTQLKVANHQLQQQIAERMQAEVTLATRAQELTRANSELERFNRAAVGREQRMIALKRQVNELLQASGKPPVYKVVIDLGESESREP